MIRSPAIGRGDLLRCLKDAPPEAHAWLAALCGMEGVVAEAPPEVDLRGAIEAEPSPQPEKARSPPPTEAKVRIVLAVSATPRDEGQEDRDAEVPEEIRNARAPSMGELYPRRPAPALVPLMEWRRLWPLLRDRLGVTCDSAQVDVPAYVEQAARMEPPRRIPRRPRRAWAREIHVLGDWRSDLAPFRPDMRHLVGRLARARGREGLQGFAARTDAKGIGVRKGRDPDWSAYRLPPAGTPILLMGDLGMLAATGAFSAAWSVWGRCLRRAGVPCTVLAPCPASRMPVRLPSCGTVYAWDRGGPRRPRPVTSGPSAGRGPSPAARAAAVADLLTLLSATAGVEPPLLRDARLLLGTSANAATEHAAWNAAEAESSGVDMVLRAESIPVFRKRFAMLDADRKREVAKLVKRHHADNVAVLFEEFRTLKELGTETHGLVEEDELREWECRVARLVTERMNEDGIEDSALMAWVGRKGNRLPAAVLKRLEVGTQVAARLFVLNRGGGAFDLPPELGDPRRYAWLQQRAREPVHYELGQSGAVLIVRRRPSSIAPIASSAFAKPFSPLCDFVTRQKQMTVSFDSDGELGRRQVNLSAASGLDIDATALRKMSVGSQAFRFELPVRPDWAERFGRDWFGAYAEIALAARVQMRLRWIPPGTFLMGSPEDEAGRLDREGPQHAVTISGGFWLAETHCTQEQWTAVMRKNPSHFKGEKNPVESLTWNEVGDFCREIDKRHPGLQARLPTEAEWEYACRAGTVSAFNDGSPCTNPEGKDPALDRLGWHEEGEKGTTHPVGEKEANAWGFRDMHGNVWEWCLDGPRDYTAEAQTDPLGPTGGPARRVVRGGSYWSDARWCRSAFRLWFVPGSRFGYLGFRLAAGRELGAIKHEGRRAEGAEPRGRGTRPPPGGPDVKESVSGRKPRSR